MDIHPQRGFCATRHVLGSPHIFVMLHRQSCVAASKKAEAASLSAILECQAHVDLFDFKYNGAHSFCPYFNSQLQCGIQVGLEAKS